MAGHRTAPKHPEQSPTAKAAGVALHWQVLMVAVGLGIAVRVACIALAPHYAYMPDHIDNMAWSDYAYQHGVLNLYDMPEGSLIFVRKIHAETGQPVRSLQQVPHACNYPPGSAFLFWAQGAIWNTLVDERFSVAQTPQIAQVLRQRGIDTEQQSLVVNTLPARFADAAVGIVFDFLLAWGVVALVRVLGGGQRRPMRDAVTFAITVLAPPVVLDSSFWNQADSWIACLLVWTLVFLLRERFWWAGVVFGVALMTKAQAILFGPVLLFVFFGLRYMPGGSWGRALGMFKTALTAAVVAGIIAAPVTIRDSGKPDNPDGAFRWFQRSYVGTLGASAYKRTTLNAFNIWWFDYLAKGPVKQRGDYARFVDDQAKVLGVTKATIGKAALALSILLTWWLGARRWGFGQSSWVACAFLVLLATFVLPTRAHERYIYFCLPFLIALAVHARAWIPVLVMLMLVGTAELLSNHFAGPGHASMRGFTALLAVLTMVSFVYAYVLLFRRVKSS